MPKIVLNKLKKGHPTKLYENDINPSSHNYKHYNLVHYVLIKGN